MSKKIIIVSVTNDLTTDHRVAKICDTLYELHLDVILVGRKLPESLEIYRNYKIKRFNLWFRKGFLFYANYNIRLFFFLLFTKHNYLWSNDLDTLLANYWCKKIKGSFLIFDSHEYFTEVPELINRPKIQRCWKNIERKILPQLKNVFTVCQSIADLYHKEYGITVKVLKNVPSIYKADIEVISLKNKKKIILYQGAINVNRGIENMAKSMNYIENAIFYIIGKGDIFDDIATLIKKENLEKKVVMPGEIPYQKLYSYTKQADLGLSLEEDQGLNYRFALPNKLFDYIHAEVPVLVSDLPEMKNIITQYRVGDTISTHTPKAIATKILNMLASDDYQTWKDNCILAKKELNWENEKEGIHQLFNETGYA